MRATSKRLCFIASIDRSNSTLSGCFEPTFARGFADFLFVQPTANASANATTMTIELRRMNHLRTFLYKNKLRSCLYLQQARASRCIQQSRRVFLSVAFPEHGIPRHQYLRSGTYNFPDRIQANAPIDFNSISVSA